MITETNEWGQLLRSAAWRLKGHQRRLFIGEVTIELCKGNPRASESRFGWGRETAAKGMEELRSGIVLERAAGGGRPRWEERNPALAADIRAIVEPKTQADPELKTKRCYTNLSAAEVRNALIEEKGYQDDEVPAERTLRDVLNRMNYRLKRIQKGRPLKKTPETNAIFENVAAVKAASQADPATLEISADTKAKVSIGDYSRGGKSRTGSDGKAAQAWDHDPPAKEKWVPFGFLVMAVGTLMLVFGMRETSDSWVDALQVWWEHVRGRFSHIKRLVIYLDNGPNNNGSRTQFLKRMVQFVDWSGLEVRLIYYPPYHSKYNPVERCWSALERKWNGVLLSSVSIMLACAARMTWKGRHPEIAELPGDYPLGVKLNRKEMEPWEARLERSPKLPKYDITIRPRSRQTAVS